MRKESTRDVVQELGPEKGLRRTTCFLSDAQDYNLDVLALHSGKKKGTLIREGIALILKQNGFPESDRVKIAIGQLATNGDARNGHNGSPESADSGR